MQGTRTYEIDPLTPLLWVEIFPRPIVSSAPINSAQHGSVNQVARNLTLAAWMTFGR